MDGRRGFLRAAVSAALAAVAMPALAQGGKETTVQAAARDWLVLADKGDGGGTWDTAGAPFREAVTRERWAASLDAVRKPLGAVSRRSTVSTRFPKNVKGAGPSGEFAVVLFRSSFANRAEAHESVTLRLETDGRWRVIGYRIH